MKVWIVRGGSRGHSILSMVIGLLRPPSRSYQRIQKTDALVYKYTLKSLGLIVGLKYDIQSQPAILYVHLLVIIPAYLTQLQL